MSAAPRSIPTPCFIVLYTEVCKAAANSSRVNPAGSEFEQELDVNNSASARVCKLWSPSQGNTGAWCVQSRPVPHVCFNTAAPYAPGSLPLLLLRVASALTLGAAM